jgi:hypothetical protein
VSEPQRKRPRLESVIVRPKKRPEQQACYRIRAKVQEAATEAAQGAGKEVAGRPGAGPVSRAGGARQGAGGPTEWRIISGSV